MNISISESGIAFGAMPTNYLDISNQNNTITNTNKIEDKTYSYKTNQDMGTLVEFRDPTNGKSVVTSLNDKVLDKLKNHFSSKDFENSEENSIKLSGEAEKFVSGWFGDIAYKREFLSADKNQDGNLDSDEYLDTKNDFHIKGTFYDVSNIEEKITTNYSEISEQKYSNYIKTFGDRVKNIDQELNKTIDSDKNFDSKMTLTEAYNTIGGVSSVLLSNAKEAGLLDTPQKSENIFDNILVKQNNSISSQKNNQEDELKKQQALMKLLQANGNASKLTAEERAVLGSELQKYKKSTDELSTSLSKALDKKIEVDIINKQEDKTKQKEKLKTLEKLQKEQDPTQLTKQEKELIQTELTKVTDENGDIKEDKLQEVIKATKTTKTYDENKIDNSKMVGRYYEVKG